MHCEKNFPLRKQQSDLDVGLDCGLNDAQYLNIVRDYLPWLLDTFRPDLVLYDAGVDPHQDDALGKLCLTDQGNGSGIVRLFSGKSRTHIAAICKMTALNFARNVKIAPRGSYESLSELLCASLRAVLQKQCNVVPNNFNVCPLFVTWQHGILEIGSPYYLSE